MSFQGRVVKGVDPPQRSSSAPEVASRRAITAIVTTLNEEANIGPCLESLSWCDEVLVVDSFSSDRTCEIVESIEGTRVLQRKYYGAASQKNWAINTASPRPFIISDGFTRVVETMSRHSNTSNTRYKSAKNWATERASLQPSIISE